VRHNSDGNYDDVSLMQETILSTRGRDGEETNIYQNLIPQPLGQLSKPANNNFSNNNNSFSCTNRNAVSGKLELFKIEPLNKRESEATCCLNTTNGSVSGPSRPPVSRKTARQQLNFSSEPSTQQRLMTTGLPLSSDTSSVDSHNDSGYSTRIAVSEGGPSPALLEPGDEEQEPLLDPQALYMIPPDLRGGPPGKPQRWGAGFVGAGGHGGPGSRTGICGLMDMGGGIVINPKSSFV
jgi:hypothetical protein